MKENRKPRIGVIGGQRGKDLCNYCVLFGKIKLEAVCDFNDDVLKDLKEYFDSQKYPVKLVKSFDELLDMNLDGIVIANYANEHAPFAIKCLKRGISVLSEVLPALNLKECVELVETVEKSKAKYCYSENYCFMGISREMKRLCDNKLLGNIEYAEGEYFHNCEPIWPSLTYGDKNHWRNTKHAFYYCTHSLGPIIHSTKLRPVKVVGFEPPYNEKMYRIGAYSAPFAIEMVTLENGAIVRSGHGQLQRNSIKYSLSGTLGRIDSALEAEKIYDNSADEVVYTSLDIDPENPMNDVDRYEVENKFGMKNKGIHYVADLYVMDSFADVLLGEDADYIDVYEAMDMFLPGIFAYKSVLNGGIPMDIPNFRIKEERDKYRNDISCTLKEVAGDQYIPSNSKGNPHIPDEIYKKVKEKFYKTKNK